MATPFPPRFFPVMMFTQLRRMLQPEKKLVFLTRSRRPTVSLPTPNSEEKCVTNFERQKPMCSLPSLESDPTPKKKSLCTLPAPLTPVSPSFVKGNCKTRRVEEGEREEEVGLGMNASLICGFELISVGYYKFGLSGLSFKGFFSICLRNKNFRAQVQAQAYP